MVRSTVPVLVRWRSLLSSSGERKSGQGGGSSAWLTSRQGRYRAGANSRLGNLPSPNNPLNSSVQPPYTVSDATYAAPPILATPYLFFLFEEDVLFRARDPGLITVTKYRPALRLFIRSFYCLPFFDLSHHFIGFII